MAVTAHPSELLRIGDVAARVGTTPRTIRYYEEIGLLTAAGERASGAHRLYDEADVERLRDLLRLKGLLGVSLEELKTIVEAEGARRAAWQAVEDPARRREILDEALVNVARQLELVRARRGELEELERELIAKRRRLRARERELAAGE
jgi:MerR family transcriptional regulator, repressor of the yfmOP operon